MKHRPQRRGRALKPCRRACSGVWPSQGPPLAAASRRRDAPSLTRPDARAPIHQGFKARPIRRGGRGLRQADVSDVRDGWFSDLRRVRGGGTCTRLRFKANDVVPSQKFIFHKKDAHARVRMNDPATRFNGVISEPYFSSTVRKFATFNFPALVIGRALAGTGYACSEILETALAHKVATLSNFTANRIGVTDVLVVHPRRESGPEEGEGKQEPADPAYAIRSVTLPAFDRPKDNDGHHQHPQSNHGK